MAVERMDKPTLLKKVQTGYAGLEQLIIGGQGEPKRHSYTK
ncbi:MAG: hypothetical protein ABI456_23360 [Ktedonobacteraceae bacterium]